MADVWANINPKSGKGNLQISVSSLTQHTGRVQRQISKTANVVNDSSKTVNLIITQAPKPVFILALSGPTEINYLAQHINNLKFKTNANGIHVAIGLNNIKIEDVGILYPIPHNFINDPGASNEVEFTMEGDVPINDTLTNKTITFTITNSSGQKASLSFVQKGIDVGIANMTIGTDFIIR